MTAALFLLSARPLNAVTPITQLPGIVDAPVPKAKNPGAAPVPPAHARTYDLIQSLNQIPEDQLNEKAGPAAPLLDNLREEDGPDFAKLKVLVARADVRKSLNPGSKGALAGLVSPRWDGFTLAGNLWLAALRSSNAEIRANARQQLVNFIQPAHIPILIHTLNVPGPNVLANDVLREVTGVNLEPTIKAWTSWWNKKHGKFDLVGHLLNQSRMRLMQMQVKGIDQDVFWYLPDGVSKAGVPYAERPVREKNTIGRWSDWARADVNHYIEQWDSAKPLFNRIVHQPDPRVGEFLRTLVDGSGFGDYASVVLAWRGDSGALTLIQRAYRRTPTVGRALARGSMGDKTALQDLLQFIDTHRAPLTYGLMDDTLRGYAARLPAYGVISAEQAFELLTHQRFGLAAAASPGEKRKAYKKAHRWLTQSGAALTLDKKHGYYVLPPPK
ncbi:MAG: hypothetical protein A2992_10255 [Elusimicrobia bacterium RIFCSPLOWO2_01_FULL_59_12]|nr:MAG: hypothetical protein A2992_10255 [Elusimicrobia bacterium RIFCSPLOWO2_01_FULL_59_12]